MCCELEGRSRSKKYMLRLLIVWRCWRKSLKVRRNTRQWDADNKRQPFDTHCCHPATACKLVKHPMTDRFKPNWHPGTLTLRAECQSARMSKTTNDGLTRSDTGCFVAVTIWQQWAGWHDAPKNRSVSSKTMLFIWPRSLLYWVYCQKSFSDLNEIWYHM